MQDLMLTGFDSPVGVQFLARASPVKPSAQRSQCRPTVLLMHLRHWPVSGLQIGGDVCGSTFPVQLQGMQMLSAL